MKQGTRFKWNHSEPENQGVWIALEDRGTSDLFAKSFLCRQEATGEEAYINPDGREIEFLTGKEDEDSRTI